MPLFDFEAFSIFAENYILSNENVAVACDINGEACIYTKVWINANVFLFLVVGLENGSISYSTNMEDHSHVL